MDDVEQRVDALESLDMTAKAQVAFVEDDDPAGAFAKRVDQLGFVRRALVELEEIGEKGDDLGGRLDSKVAWAMGTCSTPSGLVT
ncbi:MAG: hypothetical protein ACLFVJ_23600, partial [Persicimonas sp.]